MWTEQHPHWIAKAHHEVQQHHAFCVIALIPARTDTRSWHKDIAGVAHVFLLKGRLAFGQGKESAPFPSALVVWGGDDDVIVRLQQQFPSAWYVAPSGNLG